MNQAGELPIILKINKSRPGRTTNNTRRLDWDITKRRYTQLYNTCQLDWDINMCHTTHATQFHSTDTIVQLD
jgi:hypothetical protein